MSAARADRWPALSLALLLAGVFFEAFGTIRITGAVSVGDALILLSGAVVLVEAVRGRTRVWVPWWLMVALPLVIGGQAVVALSGGPGDRDDFVYGATLVFCVFIIPVVIASQRPEARAVRWVLWAWLGGNAIGALVALLQFHHWPLGFLDRWLWQSGGRVAGLNTNPNTLGYAMALMVPICLALALDTRRWLWAGLWAVAVVFCMHVADLTGSRSAIVSAGLGALLTAALFALRTRWNEVPLRLAQGAALLAVLWLVWELRGNYGDSAVERLLGRSPTAALSNWMREALHRSSLEAIGEQPLLGHGYGGLMHMSHSVVTSLLQGGGVVGLAGFLVAQAGFFLHALRLLLAPERQPWGRTLPFGLMGMWFAWIAFGLYQIPVLGRQAYILFGLSVLCGAVLRQPAAASLPPAAAGSRPMLAPLRAPANRGS